MDGILFKVYRKQFRISKLSEPGRFVLNQFGHCRHIQAHLTCKLPIKNLFSSRYFLQFPRRVTLVHDCPVAIKIIVSVHLLGTLIIYKFGRNCS